MARFNAAKMIGAIDEKFQKFYNQLIDLLDTGYMVESTIAGKKIRVEITPRKAMEITADGVSILSIDSTTGQIVIGSYDATIDALDGVVSALGGTVTTLAGAVTTLDGSSVKKDVSYQGVSIGSSTGFTSTATIDGVVYVVSVNATKGIEITADTVRVFGVGIDGKLYSSALTNGNNIIEGKISSVDGDTYFDLDTPELVQNAVVNGKAVKVEISPVNPFRLSMMGVTHMQDYVYVTDATGYSGANILVTSKYDVNEDGVIDWKDLKLVFDYVMEYDISPGVAWPAGYPAFARMDVNDNGLVNSADVQEIYEHMPSSDRVIVGGHALGIDTTGAWISDDWGDSPSYLWHTGNFPALTRATLATGVVIERVGNLRTLHFIDATSDVNNFVGGVVLAAGDQPAQNIYGVVTYSNSTVGRCILLTNGAPLATTLAGGGLANTANICGEMSWLV